MRLRDIAIFRVHHGVHLHIMLVHISRNSTTIIISYLKITITEKIKQKKKAVIPYSNSRTAKLVVKLANFSL